MVPGLDIGMEYYYKYLFKKRLKALYGFDYEQAKKALNETNIFDQTNKELKDLNLGSLGVMNDEEINLIEKEEKVNNMDGANNINMDTEKDEEKKNFSNEKNKDTSNIGKNVGSVIRGLAEVGGIIVKSLPEAGEITIETGAVVARTGISAGLKFASWILLPITCIGFGTWSFIKIKKDCKAILTKFEKASPILKFETLYVYISSFKKAISHLKIIGQQIIKDDQEENKDDQEEYNYN